MILIRQPLRIIVVLLLASAASAQGGPGRLEISPFNPVLLVGDSQSLVANGGFFRATGQAGAAPRFQTAAKWTSSNPAVATVNPQGEVTALQAGSCFIRVRSGPFHGEVRVLVLNVAVQSIAISPPSLSLPKGLKQQLVVNGLLADSTTIDLTNHVTWSSSNPSSANVSNGGGSRGLLSALAQGSATVTATLGSLEDTADITVLPPAVISIAISPADSQLPAGLTRQFTAIAALTDGTTPNVTSTATWASSNGSVASVNAAGLVNASAVGATTISATLGSVAGQTLLTVLPGRTRSSYVRTTFGTVPSTHFEDAIFDPVHKLVFANNQVENRIDVFAGSPYVITASIPMPQPRGLELLPDSSALLVATMESIFIIDPVKLQVTKRVKVPCLGFTSCEPLKLVATSNGSVIIWFQGTLERWNLATNTFSLFNIPGRGAFANDLVRSGDYSKVLFEVGDSVQLYDAGLDSFPATFSCSCTFARMAANHNGSKFVVNGTVLDGALQPLATLTGDLSDPPIFSRDGSRLYFSDESTAEPLLRVIDAATLTDLGHISDLELAGHPSRAALRDFDDDDNLVGVVERGISFVDVSKLRTLPSGPGRVRLPNALDPPQGPLASPFTLTVNGAGFDGVPSVWFGAAFAPAVALQSTNVLQVTAPASLTPGPVDVTLSFANGRFAVAPEGFTYGPTILDVVTNAGTIQGRTSVRIVGYGFAFPQAQISVTIGGHPATLVSVSPGPGISPFSFPLHNLVVLTPVGLLGPADVTVQTPAGSATAPQAFHYFTEQRVSPPPFFTAIIHDARRQLLYLGGTDGKLYKFSLQSGDFVGSFALGGSGRVEEMALTPDGSTLLVTNVKDGPVSEGTIDLVDLTTFTLRNRVIPPACVGLSTRPFRIVATDRGTAFFSSSCTTLGELNLTTLQVVPRNDGPGGSFCSGDGSQVFFVAGFDIALWNSATDKFTKGRTGFQPGECAIAKDNSVFAAGQWIHSHDLSRSGITGLSGLQLIFDQFLTRQGQYLDATGALLFTSSANGIDIFDTHHGTRLLRLGIPAQQNGVRRAFDIDPTAKRIFVVTPIGFSIATLAVLPLSFGSVSPAKGAISGGTAITIRGTNFKPGAVVALDGVALATIWIDENTLHAVTVPHAAGAVRLSITNPGGERYDLDAAFEFN